MGASGKAKGGDLVIPLLAAVAVLAVAIGLIATSLPQPATSNSATSGATSVDSIIATSEIASYSGTWNLLSAETADGNPLDASSSVQLTLGEDGKGKLSVGWAGGGGVSYSVAWSGNPASGGNVSITDVQGEENIALSASGNALFIEDESAKARFTLADASEENRTSTSPTAESQQFLLSDALVDKSRLVGDWFAENVVGEKSNENALRVFYEGKWYGMEIVLSLRADGKAVFEVAGGNALPERDQKRNGCWKAKSSSEAYLEIDGFDACTARIEQGRLAIDDGTHQRSYFKKKS